MHANNNNNNHHNHDHDHDHDHNHNHNQNHNAKHNLERTVESSNYSGHLSRDMVRTLSFAWQSNTHLVAACSGLYALAAALPSKSCRGSKRHLIIA